MGSTDQDILAPDCSPIHLRLLGQSRLKHCLRPSYFLLRSKDRMLETCHAVGWGEGPRGLVNPVKAIRVGEGGYIKSIQRSKTYKVCKRLDSVLHILRTASKRIQFSVLAASLFLISLQKLFKCFDCVFKRLKRMNSV